MTPEQKIADIERQMKACEEGRTNALNCPYCGTQTMMKPDPTDTDYPLDMLCCDTLSIAVLAILDRWAADSERQRFEQIYENVN